MSKNKILVIVAVLGIILYCFGLLGVPNRPLLLVMFVGGFSFSVPIFIKGFDLIKKRKIMAFVVIALACLSLYLACQLIFIIAFSR